MIPKIIHYAWFGASELTSSSLRVECLESWERLLPNYELKLWNEDNFDLNWCPYIREAAKRKKWAFVADYVRFQVLADFGGIWLDTDTRILKPLDELLINKCFVGKEYEKEDDFAVGCGIIGAEKEHPLMHAMCRYYLRAKFSYATLPSIFGEHIKPFFPKAVTIYPLDYFYPFPFSDRDKNWEDYIKPESFSVHHWEHTWAL